MKKILLIAFIGTLFAATSAFACDTCAKHTKSADGSKMTCSADCDKCAEKKACCGEGGECCKEMKAKACCGEGGKCCKEMKAKACCGEGGKCCHGDGHGHGHSHGKKSETATKSEGMAPCCSAMLGKAA